MTLENRSFDRITSPEGLSDKDYVTLLASDIHTNAKKISPESNRDGGLDMIRDAYKTEMSQIDESYGNGSLADEKRQEATLAYIGAINAKVGTTEWSQSKLVEDGKKANDRRDKTDVEQTKKWKESLQKFSETLAKDREKSARIRETAPFIPKPKPRKYAMMENQEQIEADNTMKIAQEDIGCWPPGNMEKSKQA